MVHLDGETMEVNLDGETVEVPAEMVRASIGRLSKVKQEINEFHFSMGGGLSMGTSNGHLFLDAIASPCS